jgi:hypothetical protein
MKSKANRQIEKEIKAVFRRYGVPEYRVDYIPSDERTIKNFMCGSSPFRMQTALTGLARVLKISMGE